MGPPSKKRSPYEVPKSHQKKKQMPRSMSAGDLNYTSQPMQRQRQGNMFPKSKRDPTYVKRPMRKSRLTPGPAEYEANYDTVKKKSVSKTAGIRWDGGSQTVSGIGFMGKPNRPGDITPGPGSYETHVGLSRKTNRMGTSQRFKSPGERLNTPGPDKYGHNPKFGKNVNSGGTLSCSMSSPSIKLKFKGKKMATYITTTPGPAHYNPNDHTPLGRFQPRFIFTKRPTGEDRRNNPGPGSYETHADPKVRNQATMKFRRPVAKLYSKCGGGWLGHELVPDPNVPGPADYKTQESKISQNFPMPAPLAKTIEQGQAVPA